METHKILILYSKSEAGLYLTFFRQNEVEQFNDDISKLRDHQGVYLLPPKSEVDPVFSVRSFILPR